MTRMGDREGGITPPLRGGFCGKMFMFARVINFLFGELFFLLAKARHDCYTSGAL